MALQEDSVPMTRKERRDDSRDTREKEVEHYTWWQGRGPTEYEVIMVYINDRFQKMYFTGTVRQNKTDN